MIDRELLRFLRRFLSGKPINGAVVVYRGRLYDTVSVGQLLDAHLRGVDLLEREKPKSVPLSRRRS